MNPIRGLESLARATRAGWLGLGQLAIVALGLHFAADHLDDHLYQGMAWLSDTLSGPLESLEVNVPEPDAWVLPSMWGALLGELLALLYAFNALTLTPQNTPLSWSTWRRALGVEAILLPLFWAPAALAGAWVMGMAAEDGLASALARSGLTPPTWVPAALGWTLMGLSAWRLGFTGWRRVVTGLSPPRHPSQGLAWAPVALGFVALLLLHGLPWRSLWP